MSQSNIITHHLRFNSSVWSWARRLDDCCNLYRTEIPIQETKMKIDVENKGHSVPPKVSVILEHAGFADDLVSELKQILLLRSTDEIYTSTMFSMNYIVWTYPGNVEAFRRELDDLFSAHKPDLLVIISCSFPFHEIEAHLREKRLKENILIPSIAESKSIFMAWNPRNLNVHPTIQTYTQIEVIILHKHYETSVVRAVYGAHDPSGGQQFISREDCPVRIKKTANMKMNICGVCDNFEYGGVGGVIVNCRNEWLRGFSMKTEPTGPVEMEILALQTGLKVLQDLEWGGVTIQTQCNDIVHWMEGNYEPAWGRRSQNSSQHPQHYLLVECEEMLAELGADIMLIDECKNTAALSISIGGPDRVQIHDEPPPRIVELMHADFSP